MFLRLSDSKTVIGSSFYESDGLWRGFFTVVEKKKKYLFRGRIVAIEWYHLLLQLISFKTRIIFRRDTAVGFDIRSVNKRFV